MSFRGAMARAFAIHESKQSKTRRESFEDEFDAEKPDFQPASRADTPIPPDVPVLFGDESDSDSDLSDSESDDTCPSVRDALQQASYEVRVRMQESLVTDTTQHTPLQETQFAPLRVATYDVGSASLEKLKNEKHKITLRHIAILNRVRQAYPDTISDEFEYELRAGLAKCL